MKNSIKTVLSVFAFILAFFVVFIGASAYFCLLYRHKGTKASYRWSASDEFDISKIATVQKTGDTFTILNLADVQPCDLEDLKKLGVIHDEITYLIETVKPDLITLTGDQTWSNENLISLKCLIGWLESYKIPYAPVFGNHDYGNDGDSAVAWLDYCCDLYESAKYCLFDRGPNNIGTLGNYVVNVMEGDKVYTTLYMIDSGYAEYISDEQIEWMKWNAEGIRKFNGGEYVQAKCFMHLPIPEFNRAYYEYRLSGGRNFDNGVYVTFSLYGSEQNGFFDAAKAINVKDIVCGHQHGNNFTLDYQGVRLTFALKTGELNSYYEDDEVYLNGATTLTLSGGDTTVKSVFVDRERFHIN